MSVGSVTSSNWPPEKQQPCCCSDVEEKHSHQTVNEQRDTTTSTFWGQNVILSLEERRKKKTEKRWQIDNEMAKSLILRIICFFCSMASSGGSVNQRLEWNKLCSKILFPKHLRLGGRERQREKIQLFSSFITSLVTNKTRFLRSNKVWFYNCCFTTCQFS